METKLICGKAPYICDILALSPPIHSKSWLCWLPEYAENLEFSAERLSENAKAINSVVTKRLQGVEPSLPFYS